MYIHVDMLTPKKSGPTLSTARIKRKQKRKKRRLVEAVDRDWQAWDHAAQLLGLNFAEFARRALNRAATDVMMQQVLGFSRGDAALAAAVADKTAEFLAKEEVKP